MNEEENDMVDRNTSKTMGSTAGGRYVNPYARGDRVVASGLLFIILNHPENILINFRA